MLLPSELLPRLRAEQPPGLRGRVLDDQLVEGVQRDVGGQEGRHRPSARNPQHDGSGLSGVAPARIGESVGGHACLEGRLVERGVNI